MCNVNCIVSSRMFDLCGPAVDPGFAKGGGPWGARGVRV